MSSAVDVFVKMILSLLWSRKFFDFPPSSWRYLTGKTLYRLALTLLKPLVGPACSLN